MKKLGYAIFAFVVMFGVITNVHAMSEEDLKNKLTGTYTIAGQSVSLRDDEKVLVERYLDENEVSATDADYIASKFDEAISIMRNAGEADYKNLSTSDKDALKALVADISNNTAVHATVLAGGKLQVQNIDGSNFATVDGLSSVPTRQTDSTNVVLISGGITLASLIAAVVVLNKKNA